MTVVAIAGNRARRILRDRISLFFLIVLPILVIVIVGAIVGGFSKFGVGVVDLDHAPLTNSLVADLGSSSALAVHRYASIDTGKTALRRAEIGTLVEIPAGTDARLRAGKPVTIVVFGERTNSDQQAAVAAVSSVIAAHGAIVQAATFSAAHVGAPFETQIVLAERVAEGSSSVTISSRSVDSKSRFLP